MKSWITLVILVKQLLNQNWIQLFKSWENEIQLIVILSNELSFGENSVTFEDVVVSFLVEEKVGLKIAAIVKVPLDDKCHITKAQINIVPH